MKKSKPVSKKKEVTVSPKASRIQELRLQELTMEADEVISQKPLSRSEENIQTPLPSNDLKCACGEPVAPGQHEVCINHIRTN